MSTESELLEMRSKINELEARLDFIYQHLNITYSNNPDEANKKVLEMLVRGNKIEAIKIYREIHNVGLAEAKRAVDGMETRLGL